MMVRAMRRNGHARWSAALLLIGGALVLGACQSTAANCDALNPGGLFSAASCVHGGGFEARQQQIRASTRQTIDETRLTRAETAELNRQTEQIRQQRLSVEQQTAAMRNDLDRLQLELGSVRAGNDADQARLDVMNEDLARLQRELAALEARSNRGDAVLEQEIETLRRDIAQREAAYRELLSTFVVE